MLRIQLWQHRGLLWNLLFRSRHVFLVTCWSWDRSIPCVCTELQLPIRLGRRSALLLLLLLPLLHLQNGLLQLSLLSL